MAQEQKKAKGLSAANTEDIAKAQQTDLPNVEKLLDKLEGKVKVIHGANDDEFDIVGQTVASVRASLVDAFNIPADAIALVNGKEVSGEFILEANMVLEWQKILGSKG